jgi:S-adenosylmethionine synthetase
MNRNFVFSSESVTEGHPDKLCDQVADAVLDRFLQQDPFSRVVTDCAVAKGILFIASRYASRASVDVPDTARQVISQIGYEGEDFNARTCTVMTSIGELADRSQPAVDESVLDNQGIERMTARNMANVFGYACTQTPAMMPLPIWLARKLARRLASVRRQRSFSYLAPDGKTQVGIEYRDREPVRIHSITLIASQVRGQNISPDRMREDLYEAVVRPTFIDEAIAPDGKTSFHLNPEGPFLVGGPSLHSGLTGRKNAVDTYGEYSRHGESALSGKDPSRIDRVGAYAARYAAKNVVAAGLATECEVQLTYAIGQSHPVGLQLETRGTGSMSDDEIAARVLRVFDFRPAAIIRDLGLRHLPNRTKGGLYRRLAAAGHVGRLDIGLPWERIDRAAVLRDS